MFTQLEHIKYLKEVLIPKMEIFVGMINKWEEHMTTTDDIIK